MRVLSFFLKLLLIFVVVIVFSVLFGSFFLLNFAVQNFRNDLDYFTQLPVEINKYTSVCQHAPGSSQYSTPLAFQIRYTSANQYNLEVVCSLIPDGPQVIRSSTLPPFVTHKKGDSGLVLGLDQDISKQKLSLSLDAFGEEKTFHFQDGAWVGSSVHKLIVSDVPIAVALPVTTCSGRGFVCCHPYAEKGVSTQAAQGVSDCADRCFASCFPIPYVQAFTIEPFPNDGQTVTMTGNTLDTVFSYSAVSDGYPLKEVSIDYGDGQTETSAQLNGLFTHTYTCNKTCRYAAALTVTDSSNQVSVATSESTYYIVHK